LINFVNLFSKINKTFILFFIQLKAYQTEEPVQYVPTVDGLHYAELSFAGQPLPQTIAHQSIPSMQSLCKSGQQQSVEYAKIEFNKTQRVNLIGGSPKFESTV
jgi:hypothetical protein